MNTLFVIVYGAGMGNPDMKEFVWARDFSDAEKVFRKYYTDAKIESISIQPVLE